MIEHPPELLAAFREGCEREFARWAMSPEDMAELRARHPEQVLGFDSFAAQWHREHPLTPPGTPSPGGAASSAPTSHALPPVGAYGGETGTPHYRTLIAPTNRLLAVLRKGTA